VPETDDSPTSAYSKLALVLSTFSHRLLALMLTQRCITFCTFEEGCNCFCPYNQSVGSRTKLDLIDFHYFGNYPFKGPL